MLRQLQLQPQSSCHYRVFSLANLLFRLLIELLVCVWVPVYCSSWNSCPQGLKRTHCKTTKNMQEPYQEQVCLQKSMNSWSNSWSLAASGRAELSICGALTATNNRVLSNRVIAASSLKWFGLPPPLILVVLLHHTINIPSMFWVGSSCFFHYGPRLCSCCSCHSSRGISRAAVHGLQAACICFYWELQEWNLTLPNQGG